MTIADVAKAAGVSPGTVSRVLNHPIKDSRISEATRKHVLHVVHQLGYRPNLFASALRTQRTGVIGVIARDISDPFLALLARRIQRVAHAQNLEVLLGHAEYDVETAGRQLNFMRNWFDGLLFVGDIPGDRDVLVNLEHSGNPFVVVAGDPQLNVPAVNIDDVLGAQQVMEYLHTLGHRRIAFVGNLDHAGIGARMAAFRRFVEAHSLFWRDDYLQHCPNTRSAGLACAQRLLNLPQPPSAIFCATDLLALGAISGAWQIGWRVPESVSIIGFDDIEEANDSFPPLTTIRQPVGELATQAMEMLNQLIDAKPELPQERLQRRVVIEPRLLVRRSCAPPHIW